MLKIVNVSVGVKKALRSRPCAPEGIYNDLVGYSFTTPSMRLHISIYASDEVA